MRLEITLRIARVSSCSTCDSGVSGTRTIPSASSHEPRAVEIEWTCDQARERGGGFGSACGTRSTDPLFRTTNFVLLIELDRDGNGQIVSAAIRPSAYDGNCFWNPPDPTLTPVAHSDGESTHEGLLLGTDRCDGLQWQFTHTWNSDNNTVVMSGTVGPVS